MRPKVQLGFCYERGGLNQKQMFFAQKLSNLGLVLNKPLQLKRVTKGAEPTAASDFCDFAAKIAILMPLKSHSARFKTISLIQQIAKIQKLLKNLNCLAS